VTHRLKVEGGGAHVVVVVVDDDYAARPRLLFLLGDQPTRSQRFRSRAIIAPKRIDGKTLESPRMPIFEYACGACAAD
jgi:FixJ family two-component response regulator